MFCDMYLPHVSGVTNHIRLYSDALQALGHEVTIFTYGTDDSTAPTDASEPARPAENGGDSVRVLRSPALAWGDTGWNFPMGVSAEARGALCALDIAHAHHPFASCLVPLRHCAPAGVPVVFTNHTRYDLYSDTYVGWMPRELRHEAIRRYLGRLNARVSLTISPSQEIAEWLKGYGVSPDRLLVFPNGIDTSAFEHPAFPRSKRELGLEDDAFVLCYVGRVAHEKNVAELLQAFGRALADDPRLALVMVGDGPARSECERLIEEAGMSERVRMLGALPYQDVPDVLAACDAFITASVSEVYPLVVVEACASGLPVIGVRSPGVGEIVADEDSGLLTDSPEELSGAIRRLAADAALHAHLSEGATRVARAHEIGQSARRLAAVYERLISQARPPEVSS